MNMQFPQGILGYNPEDDSQCLVQKKVCISVTYSLNTTILVPATKSWDEEGNVEYTVNDPDFTDCVRQQVNLPKDWVGDDNDWNEDEFEVVEE